MVRGGEAAARLIRYNLTSPHQNFAWMRTPMTIASLTPMTPPGLATYWKSGLTYTPLANLML